MGSDGDRQAMRRFCAAINAHDVDAVGGGIAGGAVTDGMPEGFGRTRQEVLRFVQVVFEAFPDIHVEVLELVAERHRVAVRVGITGTHEAEFRGIPASGKAFRVVGGAFGRFDDAAMIAELRVYTDVLGFCRQLGVMTHDAVPSRAPRAAATPRREGGA